MDLDITDTYNETAYDVAFDNNSIGSMSGYDLYAVFTPSVYYIKVVFVPFWMLVGIPGNVYALMVWSRPSMRASSGCILAALAVTDLIFLFLRLLYELQETWRYTVLEVPVLCQAFPVAFLASQYLSVILVLGMTVQRYVGICHPFSKLVERRSNKRTGYLICILSGVSLLLASIHGYFWHFDFESGTCVPRPAVLQGGAWSLWSIWSWITEMLVFGVIPFTILGLNILVIVEIVRISRRHRETMGTLKLKPVANGQKEEKKKSSDSQHERRRTRSGNRSGASTVMLLVVSFYLILVTLPVTLCYVFYTLFPEGDYSISRDTAYDDPTWRAHFVYWTVRAVVQEIGMSHFACNFYIYVATGARFRSELLQVIHNCFSCGRRQSLS